MAGVWEWGDGGDGGDGSGGSGGSGGVDKQRSRCGAAASGKYYDYLSAYFSINSIEWTVIPPPLA